MWYRFQPSLMRSYSFIHVASERWDAILPVFINIDIHFFTDDKLISMEWSFIIIFIIKKNFFNKKKSIMIIINGYFYTEHRTIISIDDDVYYSILSLSLLFTSSFLILFFWNLNFFEKMSSGEICFWMCNNNYDFFIFFKFFK